MDTSNPAKQKSIFKSFLVPLITFVMLIVGTFYAWNYTNNSIQKQEQTKFENDTEFLDSTIDNRFSVYLTVLYDIRALFAASNSVERNEFIKYLQTSNVETRFPGIAGISFAQYVKAADKDAFIQKVKQDKSLVATGYPFFTIKPPGNRPDYYVSTYTLSATSSAVASASAAFELDLLSIPERANALKKAVDTDMPVASSILTLLGNPPGRIGFAIYLPVYNNGAQTTTLKQRKDAILGVISATFISKSLFGTILNEDKISKIAMTIYDTQNTTVLSKDNLLYTSISDPKQIAASGLSKTLQFSLGERDWTIQFDTLPGYGLDTAQEILPLSVLIGGIVFSSLISISIYLLLNSRARAIFLAEKMTHDLRESQNQTKEYIDQMSTFNAKLDLSGNFLIANAAAYTAEGLSPEEFMKMNFVKGPWFSFDPEVSKRVNAAFLQAVNGTRVNYDEKLKIIGDRIITINLNLNPVKDDKGKVKYIVAEGLDISAQKKIGDELKARTDEAESLNKLTIDRELAMVGLKDRIKTLEGEKSGNV